MAAGSCIIRNPLRNAHGSASVEFALVLIVLLMLLMGVIEFGLAWHYKYAITNACREGARYGVVYHTRADGSRMPPCELVPSIVQVTTNFLTGLLPTGAYQVTVENNTAYQTGTAGTDLIVRVAAQNNWNLLGGLLPLWEDLSYTAQIVMKCE